MKKMLNDFTNEDFEKVIGLNVKITEMVENSYIESTMFWVSEQLNIFKKSLKDWSVGFYNQNYLKIKDEKQFIYVCQEIKNWYGFSEENEKLLNDIIEWIENEKNERLNNYYDILESKADQLKVMMLKHFDNVTEIEIQYLIYHSDLMIENNQFEEMYILNDDYTIIYEEIPATTKEYK